MFLIVGLGNPGLNYAYTRHNVGFMFADHLAFSLGFPDFKSKFDSLYTEKAFENMAKVFIQKPQTYMNLSGRAVSQLVSFFKFPSESVFVVHDDLDLKPLDIRIKFAGSSGGHNGVKDIEKAIGANFWRIKIGIGRPLDREQVPDYVLTPFYKDELSTLIPKIFEPLSKEIKSLLFDENKTASIERIKKSIKEYK